MAMVAGAGAKGVRGPGSVISSSPYFRGSCKPWNDQTTTNDPATNNEISNYSIEVSVEMGVSTYGVTSWTKVIALRSGRRCQIRSSLLVDQFVILRLCESKSKAVGRGWGRSSWIVSLNYDLI